MGSKGQITVFIILGIILLATFSLFLYISDSMTEEAVTSASRDVVEDVPSEFIAIQTYTESCIASTAKEAASRICTYSRISVPSPQKSIRRSETACVTKRSIAFRSSALGP